MTEEYGLLESGDDGVGDEWEDIDVADTEADRIARRQDREFLEFRKRIKNTEQFKVEASVFDDATLGALYKLVQDGYIDAFGGPISTGKEANVYTALAPDGEVAVKVYRINASDFRRCGSISTAIRGSRGSAPTKRKSSSRGRKRSSRTSSGPSGPAFGFPTRSLSSETSS